MATLHHVPFPPDAPPPEKGHAVLMSAFAGATAVAAIALRRSREPLPAPSSRDLVLASLATFKLSRLLTRERVTRFVRKPFTVEEAAGEDAAAETPRRDGPVRQAIGELLLCPFCLDHWIATGFVIGLHRAPGPTRVVATAYAVTAAGDAAQLAWRAADRRA